MSPVPLVLNSVHSATAAEGKQMDLLSLVAIPLFRKFTMVT